MEEGHGHYGRSEERERIQTKQLVVGIYLYLRPRARTKGIKGAEPAPYRRMAAEHLVCAVRRLEIQSDRLFSWGQ